MKKILCIVAVLALLAGTAFAASLNDGLTRQVYAQSKGRSVVSDKSVLFNVWYAGSGTGTIGVSRSSVNLYHNGVLTTVAWTTYGTVEKAVEYIDGLSNWEAAIGPDSWPARLITVGNGTKVPLPVATTSAGGTEQSPTYIYQDSSTAGELSAGVAPTENKINRIKSITSKYNQGTTGVVTILVYDDNTIVWRKDISMGQYNSATANEASPSTIKFAENGEKGLSGSMGKSLVAVVSASTTVTSGDLDYPLTEKLSDHNISIIYDQF